MPTVRKAASIFWIGATLLGLVVASGAGIHFETSRIELEARPDQQEVEAVFELENRGDVPAKIVSVTSGCQCLEAKAPAAALEPGAKDRITAVFKTGGISGLSEKKLHVRIDENGSVRLHQLTVAVRQREWIRIEPRTIAWTAENAGNELTFKVTMMGEDPIRLLEIEASRPGFEIRRETIREGREYRVHVKPPSDNKPTIGVFRFKTDLPHARFAAPVAFGHVRTS